MVYDVAWFAENGLWCGTTCRKLFTMWDNLQGEVHKVGYLLWIGGYSFYKIISLPLILFSAGECDGNGAAAGGDGGSNSA